MKGFTLDIELTHTIGMIKMMVAEKHNISPDWIRFVNAGRLLNENSTIAECEIDKNNDILHMIYGSYQSDNNSSSERRMSNDNKVVVNETMDTATATEGQA